MATTTDQLLIDIGLKADGIIEFFDLLAKKLDYLIKKSAGADEDINHLLGNATDITAQKVNETGDAIAKVGTGLVQASDKAEQTGKDLDKAGKQGQKAFEQLDSTAKRVFSAIKSYAGPLVAMFGAKLMFTNFLDEGAKLDDLSKSVRMNVSEIDAWRKANVAAGGSAEAFTNAMKSFTERTGASGEVFLRMGKQLNGMSGAQADYALKYMGLTRESAAVFLQNNKQMNTLVETYRKMALTPKDAENARRFKIAWQTTGMAVQNIGNQFAKFFIPYVEKAVKAFAELANFIGEHSEFIKIALGAITVAAAAAFGPRAILTNAPKVLGALFSPLGVAISLIVLLAGAIDDLITFVEGGDSVFGEFLETLGYSSEDIEGVRQSFKDAWKAICELGDALKPVKDLFMDVFGAVVKSAILTIVGSIGSVAKGIADLINKLPEIKKTFIETWESIKESVASIFDWITEKLNFFSDWKMPDALTNPMDSVKNFLGFGDDKEKKIVPPAGNIAGNGASYAGKAVKQNTVNNQVKTDVVINVNGDADPQAIKQATMQGVSEGLNKNDLLANSSTGLIESY